MPCCCDHLRRAVIFLAFASVASAAWCDDPQSLNAVEAAVNSAQVRAAIDLGLVFIRQDAEKWRTEHECSTCHHGTMTVWVLSEAKHRGYTVANETLLDMAKWTKDRILNRIDQPRDTRPGWSMVSTPAIYLALMPQAVPQQDVISTEELQRISSHLLRHQEADGSWAWSSAPAKNRPPPFFESDEVATLLASLALAPQVPATPEPSAARDARQRAAEWLAKTPASETTQAAVLRWLSHVKTGVPAETLQAERTALLKRQNRDGGWGQVPEQESDAYATGQTLYALSLAGITTDQAEVRRAVAFLIDTQKADGSWPMTRRGHPGVTPSDYTVPIVYFGSAWATLGLLRSEAR